MKIPVTIITGSLGSGKTTLLKKIIEDSNRKLAILMNEFGELAIDAEIVKGEAIEIAEIDGGCVCCSLIREFEAAVEEIIEKVAPDHIIVETTGVAEPDALLLDIEDEMPQLLVDSVIAIADADAFIRFPRIGHIARMQFEASDIIVINKTDLVESLDEVESKIKSLNSHAILFRTAFCRFDTNLLFGLDLERTTIPEKKAHDHDVGSFHFIAGELKRENFEALAESMPREIYRAKGFVRFATGSYLFHFVAGRWSLEPFDSNDTRLVFIGWDIDEAQIAVINALKQCTKKE